MKDLPPEVGSGLTGPGSQQRGLHPVSVTSSTQGTDFARQADHNLPLWQHDFDKSSRQDFCCVALRILVHEVLHVLQGMCQGVDRTLEQRLHIFSAVTAQHHGSRPPQACRPGETWAMCQSASQQGQKRAVGMEFSDGGSRTSEAWRKPKVFARPGKQQASSCHLSGPQFFRLDAEDCHDNPQVVPGGTSETEQAEQGLSPILDAKPVNSSSAQLLKQRMRVPDLKEAGSEQSVAEQHQALSRSASAPSPEALTTFSAKDRQGMLYQPTHVGRRQSFCRKAKGIRLNVFGRFAGSFARFRRGYLECKLRSTDADRTRAKGASPKASKSSGAPGLPHRVSRCGPCTGAGQSQIISCTHEGCHLKTEFCDDSPVRDHKLCAVYPWNNLVALLQRAQSLPVPAELERQLVAESERIEEMFQEGLGGYQVGFLVLEGLTGSSEKLREAMTLAEGLCREPSQAWCNISHSSDHEPPLQHSSGSSQEAHTLTPPCQGERAPQQDQTHPVSENCPRHEHSASDPAKKSPLVLGFANVTSCNQAVILWLQSCECAAVGLQETHLAPLTLQERRGTLQALKWNTFAQPAHLGDSGRRVGGVAWVVRMHRGAWSKGRYMLEGAGYEVIALQAGGLNFTLFSLYLKDSEGPTGPINAEVMARLVSLVRQTPEPWIVGGDFNCSPQEFLQTSIVQVMRGRVLATNDITYTGSGGSEIDFAVVSRSVEAQATLELSWQVPWKPHAALILTVNNAGSENPQWRLQQFPKIGGDAREGPWCPSDRVYPNILGYTGQDEASTAMATWCKQLEVCRGACAGRGQLIQATYGTIKETCKTTASLTTPAGWWGRLRRGATKLQAAVNSSAWQVAQGDARTLDPFLGEAAGFPEAEDCVRRLCAAFQEQKAHQLREVVSWIIRKEAEAQEHASKQSLEQFRQWLRAGTVQGMRSPGKPIYRGPV